MFQDSWTERSCTQDLFEIFTYFTYFFNCRNNGAESRVDTEVWSDTVYVQQLVSY